MKTYRSLFQTEATVSRPYAPIRPQKKSALQTGAERLQGSGRYVAPPITEVSLDSGDDADHFKCRNLSNLKAPKHEPTPKKPGLLKKLGKKLGISEGKEDHVCLGCGAIHDSPAPHECDLCHSRGAIVPESEADEASANNFARYDEVLKRRGLKHSHDKSGAARVIPIKENILGADSTWLGQYNQHYGSADQLLATADGMDSLKRRQIQHHTIDESDRDAAGMKPSKTAKDYKAGKIAAMNGQPAESNPHRDAHLGVQSRHMTWHLGHEAGVKQTERSRRLRLKNWQAESVNESKGEAHAILSKHGWEYVDSDEHDHYYIHPKLGSEHQMIVRNDGSWDYSHGDSLGAKTGGIKTLDKHLESLKKLKEGWLPHGDDTYSAEASEVEQHLKGAPVRCPKCRKSIEGANWKTHRTQDEDNEITHQSAKHNCGAKLVIFNDEYEPDGELLEAKLDSTVYRDFKHWKKTAEGRGYVVTGDHRDAMAHHPKDRKIRGEWGPVDIEKTGHLSYNNQLDESTDDVPSALRRLEADFQ